MITDYERIQYEIKQLKQKSNDLKKAHVWGMWDNWREFTQLDTIINDLEIKLLELDNKQLKESLKTYKNYR